MTNDEAIKTLHKLWRTTNDPWYEEVYGMAINALTAQPERIQNNAVHLCDSCQYTYVTCSSHGNDAVFGDGKGNDNICACNKYRPISAQPEPSQVARDIATIIENEMDMRVIVQHKTHEKRTETHACDLIDRQAAIDAITRKMVSIPTADEKDLMGDVNRIRTEDISVIKRLPSAQPTLYGYPVEHLVLIARVLQKENFPPERIAEMLSDVGRIVDMVRDEFEETLRKAVEQCMMT